MSPKFLIMLRQIILHTLEIIVNACVNTFCIYEFTFFTHAIIVKACANSFFICENLLFASENTFIAYNYICLSCENGLY
jgi:hypothetical protein